MAIGKAALREAWQAFCDQLVPPSCPICRAPTARLPGLCGPCWSENSFIEGPVCARTGLPLPFDLGPETVSPAALARPPAFDRARAAFRYEDRGAMLVKRLKFGDAQEYAPLLARMIWRAGQALLTEADFLVPVPLHRARLRQRRFNQAAEIARALSVLCDVPVLPDLLTRTRNTQQQVGLTFKARQRNMRGAIALKLSYDDRIKGRRLVLIDDVYTTGATVNACARALRRAGPSDIGVLTAARVVLPEIVTY